MVWVALICYLAGKLILVNLRLVGGTGNEGEVYVYFLRVMKR